MFKCDGFTAKDDRHFKGEQCRYLVDEEDRNETTIYKACSCDGRFCDQYKGYCPIRGSK